MRHITGTYTIRHNYDTGTPGNRTCDVLKRATSEVVKSGISWESASKFVEEQELAELKRPRKRAKTVFPSDEIPHLWAHKVQGSARNARHNLYFDGDVIYSYGSHFPIARHITNDKGKNAVLFTIRDYSVTTSKHKSMVRSAIPDSLPVFDVPEMGIRWGTGEPNHSDNLKYFQSKLDEAIEKSARARKCGDWHLKTAQEYRDTMRNYARFFGIKNVRPKFPSGNKLAKLQKTIRERIARAKVADAQAEERARIRNAERERIAALELAEKIELWRAHDPNVTSWQISRAPAMLRITGNEVETSKGARFPVSHAKRGLRFVRSVMESGKEYVRNGHTIHLGHYAIDRITTDGTVYAGCHVVTFAEIQRIAPQLDAVAEQQSTESN